MPIEPFKFLFFSRESWLIIIHHGSFVCAITVHQVTQNTMSVKRNTIPTTTFPPSAPAIAPQFSNNCQPNPIYNSSSKVECSSRTSVACKICRCVPRISFIDLSLMRLIVISQICFYAKCHLLIRLPVLMNLSLNFLLQKA